MNYQAAFDLVSTYLHENCDVPRDKITDDANLFKTLGLDSIDALDMVGALEARLGVPVDGAALKTIRTVKDIADYVVRNAPAP